MVTGEIIHYELYIALYEPFECDCFNTKEAIRNKVSNKIKMNIGIIQLRGLIIVSLPFAVDFFPQKCLPATCSFTSNDVELLFMTIRVAECLYHKPLITRNNSS